MNSNEHFPHKHVDVKDGFTHSITRMAVFSSSTTGASSGQAPDLPDPYNRARTAAQDQLSNNQVALGLSNVPIMTVSEPDLAMARRRASPNFANIRGQHRIVKAINNLLRGQEEQQWMTLPAIYNRLLLQPMPTWSEFIAAFKTFRILYQTYEQYHLDPNATEGNYTKTIWYTLKSKNTR